MNHIKIRSLFIILMILKNNLWMKQNSKMGSKMQNQCLTHIFPQIPCKNKMNKDGKMNSLKMMK